MSPHRDDHPSIHTARDHHCTDRIDRTDPDPELLVGLLSVDAEPIVAGFEPTPLHLDVHVAPIPFDPRTVAAGLFTMTAPDSWCAIGVAVEGVAAGDEPDLHSPDLHSPDDRGPDDRCLDDPRGAGVAAGARVVVTRSGRVATRLDLSDDTSPDHIDAASGLVVDALHRALGLASPGQLPAPAMVAVDIWLDRVVARLIAGGPTDWPSALALHPGDPGPGTSDPSMETIVESTIRSAEDFSWERIRRRVATARLTMGDLSAPEAAWMDEVMFGRWVIGSMLQPTTYLRMLHDLGAPELVERFADVADAVRHAARHHLPAPR